MYRSWSLVAVMWACSKPIPTWFRLLEMAAKAGVCYLSEDDRSSNALADPAQSRAQSRNTPRKTSPATRQTRDSESSKASGFTRKRQRRQRAGEPTHADLQQDAEHEAELRLDAGAAAPDRPAEALPGRLAAADAGAPVPFPATAEKNVSGPGKRTIVHTRSMRETNRRFPVPFLPAVATLWSCTLIG